MERHNTANHSIPLMHDMPPAAADRIAQHRQRIAAEYPSEQYLRRGVYKTLPALQPKGKLHDELRALHDEPHEDIAPFAEFANTLSHTLGRKRAQTGIEWSFAYLHTVNGFMHDLKANATEATQDNMDRTFNLTMRLVAENISRQTDSDTRNDIALSAHALTAEISHYPLLATPIHINKLRTLIDTTLAYTTAEAYLDALPRTTDTPYDRSNAAIDSAALAEMMREDISSQRYGVKLAYTQDKRGGSIIFSEPPAYEDQLSDEAKRSISPLLLQPTSRFRVSHVAERELESVSWQVDSVKTGTYHSRSLQGGSLYMQIDVGNDGELYVDPHCRLPLLPLAMQSEARYAAYRDLQMDILASYYDLTHAGEPTESDTTAQGTHADRTPSSAATPHATPYISLPRTPRASAHGSEGTRSYRLHGVVHHIRQLPEGWKASPAARALADEHGITLADGETFVREHRRGKKELGSIALHRFSSN